MVDNLVIMTNLNIRVLIIIRGNIALLIMDKKANMDKVEIHIKEVVMKVILIIVRDMVILNIIDEICYIISKN